MAGGEAVLDLTALTTVCGDYTVHILSKLKALASGERLVVRARAGDRGLVEAAALSLEKAGIARILEKGEREGTFYVVLEKRG
ncbi:hypothetical protein [Pyrodictium occultum]|nr:hypothetical protein [Pyrodictium occultum]